MDYSIEDLVNDIPKKFASRPTILKFIKVAIEKRFLIKVLNETDKRKFNLMPSKDTIEDFKKWSHGFQGF